MLLSVVTTMLAATLAMAMPQSQESANFSLTAIPAPPPASQTAKCPKFSPGPVSFQFIASVFPAPAPQDLHAIEAIRHTTALYAFAIDAKYYDTLRRIFVPNVRTNYSDPFYEINGVEPLIAALEPGLASFASTQHLLGTQYIHICTPTTAVSVTYFQATHFFTPYTGVGEPVGNDKVLIDRAQYQDTWAKQKDNTWRITNRNLVRMGPGTLDGGFPTFPDTSAYVNGP